MRRLSVGIGIVLAAVLLRFGWSVAGIREEFNEATLEQRAHHALASLRDRVAENRDRARAFRIRGEIQRIKLERMRHEHDRYDSAARRLGEIGRRAECQVPPGPVRCQGRTMTVAEARRQTLQWGTKAGSLARLIASRGNIRTRLAKAVDLLESNNGRLRDQIGELELDLEELLVQREQAEVLETLGEVGQALASGETSGRLGVFKELQDRIDEAQATATVLDHELVSGAEAIDTPLENEVLGKYWK